MCQRLWVIAGLGVLFIAIVGGVGGGGSVPRAYAGPVTAADVITVTTTTDETDSGDGACSLREALAAMPDCGAGDTIRLSPTNYTLTLIGLNHPLKGDLNITRSLTITVVGNGQAVIEARSGWNDRVLEIASGVAVSITGVTIRGGNPGIGTNSYGGGIYNDGALSLVNCLVISNATQAGGGISNYYNGTLWMSGTMVVSNTATVGGGIINVGVIGMVNGAIVSNTALGYGGGLEAETNSLTTLRNITISGNRSYNDGGGIYNDSSAQRLELNNVTIVKNAFGLSGLPSHGSGIANYGNTVFTNTLIAGNTGAQDCFSPSNANAVMISRGYNLVEDATDCAIVGTMTGVITSTAPLLGPLQDNGGNTLTHALLPGSPALNAGNNAACEATDQRGVSRPQPVRGRCDIGAFEREIVEYYLFLPGVIG